ncbi:AAA family ATPase [Rhizobium leguminosarum]
MKSIGKQSENQTIPITSFTVYSLLGNRDYTLRIRPGASIIVGPNGAGKSNFLNILYLVMSRQWARLADYSFDRIVVKANGESVEFNKDDLLEITSLIGESSRYKAFYTYLIENNRFGAFMAADAISFAERKFYSEMFKIPTSGVGNFHSRLKEEMNDAENFIALESFIERLGLGPILYMPTYRRIEKDLRGFVPDSYSRRLETYEVPEPPTKSPAFIEVISAGMDDVKSLIDGKIRSIAVEKQRTTEKTAQEYILDIVRGAISEFSLNSLKDIDEGSLLSFIETLDNTIFRKSDKSKLKTQILNLRNRTKKAPKAEERYLGLYIWKLLQAQKQIDSLEEPLRNLSKLANRYIGPEKEFNFVDSSNFLTSNGEVELNGLSSGEKQLLAMFAYLLLGDTNYILVIDEPELSLSVPWQKTLIPDILATGNCQHVFAVTHSPFIFANNLKGCLIDTESMSSSKQ